MNPWIGFGGGGDDDSDDSSHDTDYDDGAAKDQGNDGQDSADTSNQNTGDSKE